MSERRLDLDDPRQPFEQVADDLRQMVVSGQLTPGDKLDSIRALADRYHVAATTIQRALRILRDEGYLVAWQGRGVFVRSADPAPHPGTPVDASTVMRQLDVIMDRLDTLEDKVKTLQSKSTSTRPRKS